MHENNTLFDDVYMERALELALLGRFTTAPNPNVGCVIVREGKIVGEGYHVRAGEAHAEINALNQAGNEARNATVYVTLEPCCHTGRTPPCTDALIAAAVKRVVVAMPDPNPQVCGRGIYQLRQAGIVVDYIGSTTIKAKAEDINRGFLKRMRTNFPYLQLKMAASLDGRTAMASGESQWITSKEARQDVQNFRAQSDAILSTSATILADNPALTVRHETLATSVQQIYPKHCLRQPTRIIIDSCNRVMPCHRVITEPGSCLLARMTADQQIWPDNVKQLFLPPPEEEKRIDLRLLMMELSRLQINSIWVEAGATLAGALLQIGVVDELILYLAPKFLGDNARGLCVLPGIDKLNQAHNFTLKEVCQIGSDLRLRLTPNP
ncbi:riboflavin biosynthesis protein [Candidatus Regiella insecticola 5.15]|uniref:Riboflavin biosynthesis protein RibD n=1 Tax=Candidatus Regiella insecticola 5.15 TaxID=1005043 RepID=G2GWK3_9ENTR|nr:bifunctional diaminohydroxyphosphoribosylaminopyrimidine deaminase/5-amino-6-(5-phosphoribosylamino)uracil reductase RibD [Candidatus Regiella insecticola]EGY29869.1 riboflavin biosynthesis protein [Candidatus Regiella insecticola 5.15]